MIAALVKRVYNEYNPLVRVLESVERVLKKNFDLLRDNFAQDVWLACQFDSKCIAELPRLAGRQLGQGRNDAANIALVDGASRPRAEEASTEYDIGVLVSARGDGMTNGALARPRMTREPEYLRCFGVLNPVLDVAENLKAGAMHTSHAELCVVGRFKNMPHFQSCQRSDLI